MRQYVISSLHIFFLSLPLLSYHICFHHFLLRIALFLHIHTWFLHWHFLVIGFSQYHIYVSLWWYRHTEDVYIYIVTITVPCYCRYAAIYAEDCNAREPCRYGIQNKMVRQHAELRLQRHRRRYRRYWHTAVKMARRYDYARYRRERGTQCWH